MTEANLKDMVIAAYEMVAKGNVQGIASLAADDFAFYFPRQPAVDFQAYLRLLEEFRKQTSEFTVKPQRVLMEGNTIVVEFEDEATTTKGKKYRNRGVHIFDLNEEGKIRRLTEYLDTLAVVEAGLEGFLPEA